MAITNVSFAADESTYPRYSLKSPSYSLDKVARDVAEVGCCVVEDVLTPGLVEAVGQSLYDVQEKIVAEIGMERLNRAREVGVLRLMQRYNDDFIKLLEIPALVEIVDRVLSPTAIQHAQNGFIVPSMAEDTPEPEVFQMSFHQDFPRVLNGYMMSLNVYLALSDFTERTGATRLVPASQQTVSLPSEEEIAERSVSAECGAGSMIIFDSTLWHAGGFNRSGNDRLSVNHQFTRSYVKQQLGYPRAIGAEVIERFAPRTQQLLGFYSRVPASLDEYYQPPEKRYYRSQQG